MSIFQDFLNYSHRPVFTSQRELFSIRALWELSKLLGLTFLLLPILILIMGLVLMVAGQEMPAPSEGYKKLQESKKSLFYAAVILAPLIEEVLFRSWLGFRYGILIILPCFLMGVAVFQSQSLTEPHFIVVIVVGLMGLSAGFHFRRLWQYRENIAAQTRTINIIFPYLYWGSIALFASIHMGNFSDTKMGFLAIILVLPQFIVGMFLSYIRMRYGLLPAIGYHAVYNGVIISLTQMGSAAVMMGWLAL